MGQTKILIVGAGAVGLAYGFHLARSDADVTFYVKEKYLDPLRHGVHIRCLNGRFRGLHEFSDYQCITDLEAVEAQSWDQVWLCMSSPALHSGWLPSFLSAVGPSTVVTLQPGVHDYAYVRQYVEDDWLVRGMITLASFAGPLGSQSGPQAMTWWFPPFGAAPFSGSKTRTRQIVDCLRAGGFPARAVDDVAESLRFGSAMFMPLIAALEKNGWSLSQLARSGDLRLAGRAGQEACELVLCGRRRWRSRIVGHPWILRIVLWIAPKVTPFPLQEMLRAHFTKVGDQTRIMLRTYIDMSDGTAESSGALKKLLAALSTP